MELGTKKGNNPCREEPGPCTGRVCVSETGRKGGAQSVRTGHDASGESSLGQDGGRLASQWTLRLIIHSLRYVRMEATCPQVPRQFPGRPKMSEGGGVLIPGHPTPSRTGCSSYSSPVKLPRP